MAMQESAKGSAPGASSLSVDEADELAANFRPAWAADDGDDLPPNSNTLADFKPPTIEAEPPAPAPAPPAAVAAKPALGGTLLMSQSPVEPIASTQPANPIPQAAMTMPLPDAPRRAPSSPALKSTAVMNNVPTGATLPSATKPAVPVAPKPAVTKDPFAAPARPAPSVIATEELNALVPQRSNKTILFVAIGLGVLVGLGVFVKFAVMTDDPKPAASTAQTSAPPATPTAEIPPPPAKEDLPPPTTAKADPAPKDTVTAPPKADPPPTPPQAVAAAPVHHTTPAQRPVSRPHSEPQGKPNPPTAPAQPTPASKTPPKGQGGGIVRDSPF